MSQGFALFIGFVLGVDRWSDPVFTFNLRKMRGIRHIGL